MQGPHLNNYNSTLKNSPGAHIMPECVDDKVNNIHEAVYWIKGVVHLENFQCDFSGANTLQ